jgi:pimeloyl-ACP methyl ester carboxylesterase
MAPVARGLADAFRVLEPLQRGSGSEPLSVARHIEDLHEVVEANGAAEPPALVGSSWGAMLALGYAAAHPESAGPLVLIGCGTFDPSARARLRQTIEERTGAGLRKRMDRLPFDFPDPDRRFRALGELILPLYSCDLATTDQELEACDARAHHETWQDMLRLQEEGVYPAAFAAIRTPVLMLHGAADPHPGQMIRASLAPHIPQLEYREWERCGHFPWLERSARDEFFSLLRNWLTAAVLACHRRIENARSTRTGI